jgi:hypothetical protein
MKRLAFLAVVACLCGCALVGTGRAESITYTETFTATGTLTSPGGTVTPFTGAQVTITATADTGNSRHPVPGVFLVTAGSATIAGIGTGNFTDILTVADNTGSERLIIADTNTSSEIVDTTSSAFATYDLSTSIGPVSGPPNGANNGSSFNTSLGELQFTSFGSTSTFTATLASAAPEPASLTLLGIGAAGLAGYGWRKRRRAAA